MQIEVSAEAQDELLDILKYGYEMFGEDASEAYLRGFDNAFALIVSHPAIGALHDHVRPPIRSLPYGSHRIFYDVFENLGTSINLPIDLRRLGVGRIDPGLFPF